MKTASDSLCRKPGYVITLDSSWFIIFKMICIPGQDRNEYLSEMNDKHRNQVSNSCEDETSLKGKGSSIITECWS